MKGFIPTEWANIKANSLGDTTDVVSVAELQVRKTPTWYLWYFALAAFYLLTLSASLALIYWESRSFRSAIDSHELTADLLRRTSMLRTLSLTVNAPGNDVFQTHDYVNEAKRLELAAEGFREALREFSAFSNSTLKRRNSEQLTNHVATIEQAMVYLLTEARQVFSFLARNDSELAAAHMARMDQYYSEISTVISLAEQMLQAEQQTELLHQNKRSSQIEYRGAWLLIAAVIVMIAATVYGRRVVLEMRRDSLHRERTAKKLAHARDQAEQAAKIKSQFLANMSHEIRTPMNGVIGMLEVLSQTPLSLQQSSLLKTANTSADLLLSIIDDILDFSKIEAGMLFTERVPIDVHQVVQHVISLYNVKAVSNDVQLDFDIDESVPHSLLCDSTRITQLLANFVSNAIKFSSGGRVTIRIAIKDQQPESMRLRFEVSDTGIGIDEAAQQRLFSAFTQADGSTSRRFGGTGLGLAICKQLVHLLDPQQGEIGVSSEPGKGSTFYFVLALAKTDKQAINAEAADTAIAQRRFSARVLVAEDNDVNQQVIQMMLKNLGVECVIAENGLKALTAFRDKPFDMVLMDYHMPVLDGVESAQKMREWEVVHQLPRTPIIAVTASVLTEDRAACTAAGMDDFLAKPIKRIGVIAILDKWLSPQSDVTTSVRLNSQDEIDCPSSQTASKVSELEFDTAQYQEMRCISGAGFSALLDQFHANVRSGIIAIRAAIEAGDSPQLKSAAHKLKGTTATLGATGLAAYCYDLEQRGKESRLEGAMPVLELLSHRYLQYRAYMEQLESEHRLAEAS
jgi:signal transduction histidine kinase/CheY-like chemotaxis protein/HPt (histidine-containing phosphotransfer) domain-containing protein